MPIKMNRPNESSFGINIDDSFDPAEDHTVELIDMDEYNGVSKVDGKPYTSIKWIFRIFDADGVTFTNLIDGGPYETWQFSSKALSGKSNGRAWANALMGHELTDEECDKIADRFDEALVGKRARASWKVETDAATGNKRLKIALLRPERKTRPAPPAARPTGPSAQTLADDAAIKASVAREEAARPSKANGTATSQARESAAARRAALEAELAGLSDEDTDEHELPF